jgi:hypothetical protein
LRDGLRIADHAGWQVDRDVLELVDRVSEGVLVEQEARGQVGVGAGLFEVLVVNEPGWIPNPAALAVAGMAASATTAAMSSTGRLA